MLVGYQQAGPHWGMSENERSGWCYLDFTGVQR
jgi:hypothetical protein